MCVSGDGATVLVVLSCSDVFVWQLRPGVTIFDAAPADVTGRWSRVGCDDDRALPGGGQTEACVHAVFCINDRCVSNAIRSKAVLLEEFCNEERGSSEVECWSLNRESPGSNPLCYCFEVWAFSFSP